MSNEELAMVIYFYANRLATLVVQTAISSSNLAGSGQRMRAVEDAQETLQELSRHPYDVLGDIKSRSGDAE